MTLNYHIYTALYSSFSCLYYNHCPTSFYHQVQQQILSPPCRCRRCCGSHSKGRSTWVSACCPARRCADPVRPLPEEDLFPFYSKPHQHRKQSFSSTCLLRDHRFSQHSFVPAFDKGGIVVALLAKTIC